MEEEVMEETAGLNYLQAPIPGESLTNDPASPHSFEKPPEFTDYQSAVEYIGDELINADRIPEILDLIRQGAPLTAIAQMVLFSGFTKGKWNPDLFLMLIEPTVYILLFICEMSGVEYQLHYNEGMDISGEDELAIRQQIRISNEDATVEKAKSMLPPEVVDKAESLLSPEGVGNERV